MRYYQITPEERYMLAALRRQVPTPSAAAIAQLLGRHRSTITRELKRNACRYDGRYRYERAQEQANARRVRTGSKDCIVTLVERVTGCVLIGKLTAKTTAAVNQRILQLIEELPHLFRTITVDNGTEFHGYEEIERATGVRFYFATPYHSWERGTNENTNGLIRQYLPKRTTMKGLTQTRCNDIACILNNQPRKRHAFATPLEKLHQLLSSDYNHHAVRVAVQT